MTDTSPPSATTSPGSAVNGIDVSHYQRSIDWGQVAAQGIGFAFVKATDGLGTDPNFTANWSGASQAGIIRGAYHFFRPRVSAIDQAKHFCDVVGSLGVRDLPPVLDVESLPLNPPPGDEWDALQTPDAKAKVVTDWLTFVTGALQKKPILYTYRSFWQSNFGAASAFAAYPLWIAAYSTVPVLPASWQRWVFWQHTANGRVSGIIPAVDLDQFNGTMDDLEQFAQSQSGGPTDAAVPRFA